MYSKYQSIPKILKYADEISQDIVSLRYTYERAQKIHKLYVYDDNEPISSAAEHYYIKELEHELLDAKAANRLHSPNATEDEKSLQDAVKAGDIINFKKLLAFGTNPNKIRDSDLAKLYLKAYEEYGTIMGTNRNLRMQGIGFEADDARARMPQPPSPKFIFAYQNIIALLSGKKEPTNIDYCVSIFDSSPEVFMQHLRSRKYQDFTLVNNIEIIKSFSTLLHNIQKQSTTSFSKSMIAAALHIPPEYIASITELPIVGLRLEFKNTKLKMIDITKIFLDHGIKCSCYEGDGRYLSPSITIEHDSKEKFIYFIQEYSKTNSSEGVPTCIK